MTQLVQLKKVESSLADLNWTVISVLREEKDGAEGAKKAAEKTNFTPILVDTPVEATSAYAYGGFPTYLINTEGKVVSILGGTKKIRPTGENILIEIKKLSEAD